MRNPSHPPSDRCGRHLAVRGLLATLTLLGTVGASHASLVVTDWQTSGDGLLTLDTDTQLLWLDWTQGTSMSVNQVMAQLGAGGSFEGFRYATVAEVHAFFSNAGIPNVPGITAANLVPVQNLLAIVGVTAPANSFGPSSSAWTADSSSGNRIQGVLQDRNDDLGQATTNGIIGFDDDFAASTWGHALVSVVPEPGTGVLLLLGMLGLAVAGRRRPRRVAYARCSRRRGS
jgi:hypothetical protein